MAFAFDILFHLLQQTVYFIFVFCIFLRELQTVVFVLSLHQVGVHDRLPVYFGFPPIFLRIDVNLGLDFVDFVHFKHLLDLTVALFDLGEVQSFGDDFHLESDFPPGFFGQLVQFHPFLEGEFVHGRTVNIMGAYQEQNLKELKYKYKSMGNLLQQLSMSGLKPQSLQSPFGNLSNNFLYNPRFIQSDFFRSSLNPYQATTKPKSHSNQEILLGSLILNPISNPNKKKTNLTSFTMNWTNDGKNQAEGISDDEFDQFHPRNENENKTKVEPKEENSEDKKETGLMVDERGRRNKNETKNIPKNFGKAIIIFVEKNKKMLRPIFERENIEFRQVFEELQKMKKNINTIADLRYFWTECEYSKSMRIVSNLFLRKYSYSYIFNSRIKSRLCHVKYKKRLEEAIKEPSQFLHIKDY